MNTLASFHLTMVYIVKTFQITIIHMIKAGTFKFDVEYQGNAKNMWPIITDDWLFITQKIYNIINDEMTADSQQ